MAILRIYLISRISRGETWGEGSMYQIGNYLKGYFDQVCQGNSDFDNSDFWWEVERNAVTDRDLLCYLVRSPMSSIVQNHTTQPLGPGGSTVWSTRSHAMISEVYMSACEGDAARNRLIANMMFHELMHNKLDAHPNRFVVQDVHSIRNGSLSHIPINSSKRPSPEDIDTMRRGLTVRIPQYTRGIR